VGRHAPHCAAGPLYLESKENELREWNTEPLNTSQNDVNKRRITNIGTFRAYVIAYLKAHPGIAQGKTLRSGNSLQHKPACRSRYIVSPKPLNGMRTKRSRRISSIIFSRSCQSSASGCFRPLHPWISITSAVRVIDRAGFLLSEMPA